MVRSRKVCGKTEKQVRKCVKSSFHELWRLDENGVEVLTDHISECIDVFFDAPAMPYGDNSADVGLTFYSQEIENFKHLMNAFGGVSTRVYFEDGISKVHICIKYSM